MTGLDTGFFVELLRGKSAAVAIWETLIDGSEEATVSCLTLFEIERLGMKGGYRGGRSSSGSDPGGLPSGLD